MMGNMASQARITRATKVIAVEPQANFPALTETNTSSDSESKWPCANCHSVVHVQDERCPMCHGIQVKIPPESPGTLKRLFERLSPATVTPLRERGSAIAVVSVNTSASTYILTEIEDDDLSVSVGSPEHDTDIILEDDLRPTDPVAVTLAAVPSPLPGHPSPLPGHPSPLPGQKIRIDSKERATLTLVEQRFVPEDAVLAVDVLETKRKIGNFSKMDEPNKKLKAVTEAT
jgi:hypothetical protein